MKKNSILARIGDAKIKRANNAHSLNISSLRGEQLGWSAIAVLSSSFPPFSLCCVPICDSIVWDLQRTSPAPC
jgi:hypothetical protein